MAKGKRPAGYADVQFQIGQRLKWARELVWPNRAEFARLMGIDRSTLCKIEDGNRAPSVFIILDAAHKLRMTPNYFLTGSLTGSDAEMAVRLVTAHPKMALEPVRKPRKGKSRGTLRPPRRREPAAEMG